MSDPLPELIVITEDMPYNKKLDTVAHNARVEEMKRVRLLPKREQIELAVKWNSFEEAV